MELTMKYKDATLPVQERVADLLARMTLEEKVAQLLQVGVSRENRSQVIERIRQNGMGSRIYGGYNMAGDLAERIAEIEDLNELQRIAVEESRLGIPMIHGRDVIHGFRTVFPIPLAMAASFDPDAVEQAYAIAGREAACDSVHWSFAPMLDIARDPRWGRIIEDLGRCYLGAGWRLRQSMVF
jgi:beta-glucosidase